MSKQFKQYLGRKPPNGAGFWQYPIGNVQERGLLFNGSVYIRGGLTLEALRQRIGNDDFFELLRTWATDNRYGNVRTAQFTALAERISGRDLDRFFFVWLERPAWPENWRTSPSRRRRPGSAPEPLLCVERGRSASRRSPVVADRRRRRAAIALDGDPGERAADADPLRAGGDDLAQRQPAAARAR